MQKEDITGKRFGNLTVIGKDITKKELFWLCKCDCGNTISNNQREFARKYNLNRVVVSACLNKKQKEHKGWSFQFI